MNIVRFSIRAIRKAGLRRFLAIVAVKSYRSLFEKNFAARGRTARITESIGFNGVLPLEASTATRFKKEFPSAFLSLLASAQKLRTQEFEFLGLANRFDKKINWHLDPMTKREWRKEVYREISLHYDGSPSDVKPVWELNRHQYFVILAQAFYLSGDRAYLDELIAQWLDWIEENPYRIGINWASPLEIGIRLISWTLAFQFIEAYLSKRDRTTIIRSLWQQSSFLSSHLSVDKVVRTNHLIGEAAGLFIVASSFAFEESEKWIVKAYRILEEEIRTQVFTDGVVKEQSSSYQLFDVDFFLLAYVKATHTHRIFSIEYAERLLESIRCLHSLQTPDHRLPPFGDNDDGRGFRLRESNYSGNASGVIGIGAVVFHDKTLSTSDYCNEESFWLLTEAEWKSANSQVINPQAETCTIFKEGGHVILRNGRSSTSDYCFFRAGSFGLGEEGFSSHSHNDLFSPIIYLNGNLVLTDTGTSVYLGKDDERDYLRSAAAHNATFPASWKFFETKRWFGWKNILNGTILRKTQTADEIRIECAYEATKRFPYKRTMIYKPLTRQFQIEDLFTENTNGVHTYFHLDSGLSLRMQKEEVLILRKDAPVAYCTFPDNLQLNVEEGWISKSYGVKESSVILHFTWNATARVPAVFTFAAS